MKMKSLVFLFVLLMMGVVFSSNALEMIPADVDFALEIKYPEKLVSALGMENMVGQAITEVPFLKPNFEDYELLMFGHVGIDEMLLELDLYDLEYMLSSPEELLLLTGMPVGVVTNIVNLPPIIAYLNGPLKSMARENDVLFEHEVETVQDLSIHHFLIRSYEEYEPIFIDLYFAQLSESHFLVTGNRNLLDSVLMCQENPEESLHNKSDIFRQTSEKEGFVKLFNQGFNISWPIMRLMGFYNGHPKAEAMVVDVEGNNITASAFVDVSYPSDYYREKNLAWNTDRGHYKKMPDFEDTQLYFSWPGTNLSISMLFEMMEEFRLDDLINPDIMDFIEIPAMLGPEITRTDMFLSENNIPYFLVESEDPIFVLENIARVKQVKLERLKNLNYVIYDNFYFANADGEPFIEIAPISGALELLGKGELEYLQEMPGEAGERSMQLPQEVTYLLMYEDLFGLTSWFDESGNVEMNLRVNMRIIEETAMRQANEERFYQILDVYSEVKYWVLNYRLYESEETLNLEDMRTYMEDWFDPQVLEQFNIVKEEITEDGISKTLIEVSYQGEMPGGFSTQELLNELSYGIYEPGVEAMIEGDSVILSIPVE